METNTSHISTWDRIMMAITFAEVGEHETARQLLNENRKNQRPDVRNQKSEQRAEIRA